MSYDNDIPCAPNDYEDDPLCARCGAKQSLHAIEPPYELDFGTYCEGFLYAVLP